MDKSQKKEFQDYLKQKNKKKFVLFFILMLPVFFLFLVQLDFTGNVVNESVKNYSGLIEFFSIFLFVLLIAGFLVIMTIKYFYEKRFNQDYNILEKIISFRNL